MNEIFVEKFGGASINDAKSLRNVVEILEKEDKKRVIVFSAMGKTTNSLESLINDFYSSKQINFSILSLIKDFHFNICNELIKDKAGLNELEELFNLIPKLLKENTNSDYNRLYDSIVVFGELISTKIISLYFDSISFSHKLLDARELIHTNSKFRNADIDWEMTNHEINKEISKYINQYNTIITQGFIGSDYNNHSTTLGREGSDFSAAILAHCLDANSMTIWKDVPGLLNADPKKFANTIKFESIPFRSAIELSYYGASIIHPKTIKPLENKNIPLYVKSFLDYNAPGTIICKCDEINPLVPSYIFKDNQVLVSITPKDFSFIAESNISHIFSLFDKNGIKINLMQNSALSFSVCFDENGGISKLIDELRIEYRVKYNQGLRLITIRHYKEEEISKLIENKEVLIEQRSRITAQYLISN